MIQYPRALIFLDLDGPMIPLTNSDKEYAIPFAEFPYNSKMSAEACRHIEALCSQFNAAVVTNSTHNNGPHDREPMFHVFDLFEKNCMSHVLLDGDYITQWADIAEAGRKEAIVRWRKAHSECAALPFVVFDDNALNFEGDPDFPFVHTGEEGIRSDDFDLAVQYLSTQPGAYRENLSG